MEIFLRSILCVAIMVAMTGCKILIEDQYPWLRRWSLWQALPIFIGLFCGWLFVNWRL